METEFHIIKPHEEAAAIIEGKPAVARSVFDNLLPELKARAFTVAGIEDADVLQRIRDAIAEIPRGARWDDAKEEVVAELDPWLGEGSEKRAELVMRTQTFTAFQTQTWRQAQEDDDTTHLQYMTMEDDRVRDSHAALDGLVLPKDDEFWNRHYPPWEWNCRCQVRTMNPDQVDEERKNDEDREPENQLVLHGAMLKKLREGHLIRDGQAYDVSAPSESDPSAFAWHPDDLRIPLDTLKERYDPETFASFEKWSKATEIEEGQTVWEWLHDEIQPTKPAPIAFEDVHDAMEWANGNMHPDNLGLNEAQRQGLAEYQISSSNLNLALRMGNLDGEQAEQVGAIDSALRKSSAPADLIVWHGSPHDFWGHVKEGDEVQLKNYLSTTLAEDMTSFKSSTWIRIHVPRGAPAIYMDALDDDVDHEREVEVVLSRGSRLRINSIENDGETAYIEATLI